MEINADMKCFRSTNEWKNNLQVKTNVSMTFYWQFSSKNSVSLRTMKFRYIEKGSNFLYLLYDNA